MDKYYYRLKKEKVDRKIVSQRVQGYRITRNWTPVPERLKLGKLEEYVEERVDASSE